MVDLEPLLGPQDALASEKIVFRVFPKRGTPRWMLEARYCQPWHLKTWPRSSLRARLIHRVARLLARLHIHLPSRRVSLCVAKCSPYAELRNEFSRLGIFLGTPGANRKFVVFAENEKRSVFVKIPTSSSSSELVRREAQTLATLSDDARLAPLIPSASQAGGHLAIENVEVAGVRYGRLSQYEVARVYLILFERSETTTRLGELTSRWLKRARLEDPTVPETASEADRLVSECTQAVDRFLNEFSTDHVVTCYQAHGDLTAWNTLVAEDGTARIIDWELLETMPRHFDFVHYFVSSDILVARMNASDILVRLDRCRKTALDIVDDEEWLKDVGLYFCYQASYYGQLYKTQRPLHKQALWQLRTWRDALKILLSQLQSVRNTHASSNRGARVPEQFRQAS